MLTEPIKVEKREASEYKPLPENIYQVELLDVTALQKPTYDTKNKPDNEKEYATVLKFQFTLLSGMDNGESLRGRNLWKDFVPTHLYVSTKHGKNALYQITEALLCRNLTPEDEATMDEQFLNSLIGKQCRVGIKNTVSGEKTYSNIVQFYPAEALLISLNAEEKEKAKVKPKDEQSNEPTQEDTGDTQEIKVEDIPF